MNSGVSEIPFGHMIKAVNISSCETALLVELPSSSWGSQTLQKAYPPLRILSTVPSRYRPGTLSRASKPWSYRFQSAFHRTTLNFPPTNLEFCLNLRIGMSRWTWTIISGRLILTVSADPYGGYKVSWNKLWHQKCHWLLRCVCVCCFSKRFFKIDMFLFHIGIYRKYRCGY